MNLHLIDASQLIYSGSKSLFLTRGIIESNSAFKPREMPCGGIAYLLNAVIDWSGPNEELVFCFDRPPTIKRELFQAYFPHSGFYKGTRVHSDKSIPFQKDMAEEMAKLIGLNTVAVECLEADDVIASLVQYYKDSYEKIYIHSKDSDLFYLVSENVEIMPLVKDVKGSVQIFGQRENIYNNGKHINMENWEREVLKDRICPYDVLTVIKLCDGETGDNIPPIAESMAQKIVRNLPKEAFVKCGDNKFLREYVLNVTNNDARVRATFDLIAPIIAKYDDVALYCTDFDEDAFRYLAQQVRNKHAKNWNVIPVEKIDNAIEKYLNLYNEE